MKGFGRSRFHAVWASALGLLLMATLAIGLAPRRTGAVAQAGGGSGDLTVRFLVCPEDITEANFDRNACSPVSATFEVQLTGDSLETPEALAESLRLSNGVFRWNPLEFGSYELTVTQLPEGYSTVYVPEQPSGAATGTPVAEAAMTDATPAAGANGFSVTLDASNPSPVVSVFFLIGGSEASPAA